MNWSCSRWSLTDLRGLYDDLLVEVVEDGTLRLQLALLRGSDRNSGGEDAGGHEEAGDENGLHDGGWWMGWC